MFGDYSIGGLILTSLVSLVVAIVLYPICLIAFRIWKAKQNLEFYRQ